MDSGKVDLQKMAKQFRKADFEDTQHRLNKDGKINIGMVKIDGSVLTYNDSEEKMSAYKIVMEAFGLQEQDREVAHEILLYFDQLDGKSDGLVDLKALEKFAKDISTKGAAKDKFVRYLEEKRDRYSKFAKENSPTGGGLLRAPVDQSEIDEFAALAKGLDKVISMFK